MEQLLRVVWGGVAHQKQLEEVQRANRLMRSRTLHHLVL